jgi:hypothetical protein
MPPRRRARKDYDEPQPPEETPEDEESIRVHEAFLEHRLAGGEPAGPEAILRAAQQFERLPGAIRTGPVTGRRVPEREPAPPTEPEEYGASPGDERDGGQQTDRRDTGRPGADTADTDETGEES